MKVRDCVDSHFMPEDLMLLRFQIVFSPQVLRMRKHAKAYFRRGQANYGLHNYDAALDDLSEALQLEPSDKLIHREIKSVKLAKIHARFEDKERFANMLK